MDDIRNSQGERNVKRVLDMLDSMIEHDKFRRSPQCDKAASTVVSDATHILVILNSENASVLRRAEYKRARRVLERWGGEEACVLANVAEHNIKRVTLGAMLVVFGEQSRRDAAKLVGISEYRLRNYLETLRVAYELVTVAHNRQPKVGQPMQKR